MTTVNTATLEVSPHFVQITLYTALTLHGLRYLLSSQFVIQTVNGTLH